MSVVVIAEEAKRWQGLLEPLGAVVPVEIDAEICELADATIDVVRALGEGFTGEITTVIGVGPGGRAAQLIALAGRASSLALIDGITHRFAGPTEVIAARMEWMRQRVAGEFPPIPRVESQAFAQRAAAAVRVPTLVVERSASQSPPEVVDVVVSAFPRAVLRRVDGDEEAAAQVASWIRE